jgi:YidC/Oxa1 family membrane protein insertase
VGVLIYWSTTNLWTWGQQFYVIKRNPTPGSPAYEELQRKRAEKDNSDKKASATGDLLEIEEEKAPEVDPQGQRKQPKKRKKKK